MTEQIIVRIPIALIRVVNPRSRSKVKWQSIVQSINTLGLKRPIKVSRRDEPDPEGKLYDLAFGQGRLEAFQALGEETIPAIIVNASEHDLMLMSLVENIARRPAASTAILHEVRTLRQRGYTVEDISTKLGIDRTYIYGIVHLIDRGEEYLVNAVEAGRVPMTVAIEIAAGNDQEVSRALSEAYDKGEIRGHDVTVARRIVMQRIARRRREGKAERDKRQLTGEALVREYKQKIREQKALVAKAERTRERLILLTSALRTLLADENFTTLLKAEGLQQMPAELVAKI